MTALTDREIRLARALYRASVDLRGEIECYLPPDMCDDEDLRIVAEMGRELDEYEQILAEIGVSIEAPFALPPLPADYWLGNT